MKKISSKDRSQIISMDNSPELRFNLQWRLRNAVLALALNDKNWMIWLEKEVDPKEMEFRTMLQLIESRARALTLKHYHYYSAYHIGEFIFTDWPFTDSGNLSPG